MDSNISSAKNFGQDVRNLAKSSEKKQSGPMGEQVSELEHNKKSVSVQAPISVTNKKVLNAARLLISY